LHFSSTAGGKLCDVPYVGYCTHVWHKQHKNNPTKLKTLLTVIYYGNIPVRTEIKKFKMIQEKMNKGRNAGNQENSK